MSKKKNTKAKGKRQRGRPTIYTKKLAEEIYKRLRSGRTLTSICKDSDMPHRDTVATWGAEKEDFSCMYARARAEQLRMMHDDIIDLADATDYAHDKNYVNRQRLMMDARKFTLAKSSAKFPKLMGSLKHQVDQVEESYSETNITTEAAELLLKMITAKAQILPVDEYGDKLKEIVERLSKINDTRNEQQAEKKEK